MSTDSFKYLIFKYLILKCSTSFFFLFCKFYVFISQSQRVKERIIFTSLYIFVKDVSIYETLKFILHLNALTFQKYNFDTFFFQHFLFTTHTVDEYAVLILIYVC